MVLMCDKTGEHSRRMLKKVDQQGRSERRPEAYPLGYVEDLNDARTLLADFFSILLRVVRLTSLRTVLYDAGKNMVRGRAYEVKGRDGRTF